MKRLSQKGQSLLEVTLALGILIIILGAMTIISINGLRNGQFSKNQSQATKLAQEGIDAVQTVRSQNCPVTDGAHYYWRNMEVHPTDLSIWDSFSTSPRTFHFTLTASPFSCSLTFNATPQTIGVFSRTLTLTRLVTSAECNMAAPASCIRVISDVSWTDVSGPHESKLVTIMTQH